MFGPSGYVPPYGLLTFNEHQHPTPLPLVRVVAKASIVDLSASVLLTQVYRNEGSETVEASYVFPVPDKAAVNGFAMVKEDGTRVVGVVEEKVEARRQYDEAVEAGNLASLTEQATPDTFRCSVGNILPQETVTIELSYVTELTEGDTSDSIRFHLPSRIGARYGRAPSAFAPLSHPVEPIPPSPFTVSVNIETASPLTKISCPSHTISTELGPDPSLANACSPPFANYARVAFTFEASLERDFALELSSPGLDSPRCLAEKHPSSDSVAVSLTFVPRFKLPEVENQEFVFLVDRSGSMQGSRIAMAKKAMVVLLRSLPHKGTTFNIVSFGSDHKALWETGSRAYNQSTLDEATALVDSMEADFGGTEMRNALEYVFKERKKDAPTSVFVLTDGDAWDLDGVYTSVKNAVSSSTDTSPLRVFVLGISNSASTAMCEGIARHGRGLAQFVVDGESFTGKCNRLLKAAKSPAILNARFDYGVKTEERKEAEEEFEVVEPGKEGLVEKLVETVAGAVETINLFDKNIDPLAAEEPKPAPEPEPVELPPPPAVQQAPSSIHGLYPGARLHAYAILSPASLLPSTVTLRGELASGQQVELDIPVTSSELPPATASSSSSSSPALAIPPPIHTLTARKLVQSLEDGEHDLSSSITDQDLLARTIKAHIVRLGKTYSLVSTHTSCVAIDEAELRKPRRKIEVVEPAPQPVLFSGPSSRAAFRSAGAPSPVRLFARTAPALFPGAVPPPPPCPAPLSAAATFAAPSSASPTGGCYLFASPGAPPALPGGLFGAAAAAARAEEAAQRKQAGGFNTFGSSQPSGWGGSFGGGGGAMMSAAAPREEATEGAGGGLFGAGGEPLLDGLTSTGDPLFGSASPTSTSSAVPHTTSLFAFTLSPSDRLDAIARLQAFDGSFSPSALPLCKTSLSITKLAEKLPAGLQKLEGVERVVATLVVLAFWEREMKKEEEEWEEMAGKGRGFVGTAVGRDDDEVVELVKLF